VTTTTFSLKFVVRVTTLPTPTVPLPEVMPVPEVATEVTGRGRSVNLQGADRIGGCTGNDGDIANNVLDHPAIEVQRGYRESAVFCPAATV
jgi:hypothetical protein